MSSVAAYPGAMPVAHAAKALETTGHSVIKYAALGRLKTVVVAGSPLMIDSASVEALKLELARERDRLNAGQ